MQLTSDAERAYVASMIKSTRLFARESNDDIGELVRSARRYVIERGRLASPAKGKGSELYLIESGAVAELYAGPDGALIMCGLHGRGAVTGISSPELLGRHRPEHKPTAPPRLRAVTHVATIAIPVAAVARIRDRSETLTTAIALELRERLTNLMAQHARALTTPLEVRLARLLDDLADLNNRDDWRPTANLGPIPQTQLAQMLGVAREYVNRILSIWQRSGMIFSTKNGELIVRNRNRLRHLSARDRVMDPESPEHDRLWEIDVLLDHGLNQEALDLALEGVKRAPKDLRFQHRAVLATARAGATTEALQIFNDWKLNESRKGAEILCLRPRLLRDLAYTGSEDAPLPELLAEAATDYENAFREAGGYYAAINAAACYAILGDRERAMALASAAEAEVEKESADLDVEEETYWVRATRAECALIAGKRDDAARLLRAALAAHDVTLGKKSATRRQLRRLGKAAGIDAAWIEAHAPQPDVLFFSGPLATDGFNSAAALMRIRQEADKIFRTRRVSAAFGALACGADIVIAEAALEADIRLHVHLPLPLEAFLKSSIEGYGDEWERRFADCVRAAQSVEWNRSTVPCEAAFRLGAACAMGRAVRHAGQLTANAIGIFGARRQQHGDSSVSAYNANLWRSAGLSAIVVEDDWPPVRNDIARMTGEAERIAFALAVAAPREARAQIARDLNLKFQENAPADDIDMAVFDRVDDAWAAARNLASSAWPQSARIYLDVGVVSRKADLAAAFVITANKPITTPGRIYASEAFALASAVFAPRERHLDYAGLAPTAEKLEPCALYAVR